jgi:hypothetical protein
MIRHRVFYSLALVVAGTLLGGGVLGAEATGLDVKTAGDVSYVSGGVGVSSREALEQAKKDFNLRLLFAYARSGEYLSNIGVKIVDRSGNTILDAVSDGPFFYAKLPAGSYRVSADNAGQVQTRSVRVPASGAAVADFYWKQPQ